MSLPKWIGEVAEESPASIANFTPRLIQAVSILWETVQRSQAYAGNPDAPEGCRNIITAASLAMRKVEELGK